MESRPNCSEDCEKCKECNNHNASLDALSLTVGNWAAATNIPIDESINDILKLLDGVVEGKVPPPEIRCPNGNDILLIREGYNFLIERRAMWNKYWHKAKWSKYLGQENEGSDNLH